MTEQQIKWAASHDWYHSTNGNGSVLVYERVCKNGIVHESMLTFTDVKALREWAGY